MSAQGVEEPRSPAGLRLPRARPHATGRRRVAQPLPQVGDSPRAGTSIFAYRQNRATTSPVRGRYAVSGAAAAYRGYRVVTALVRSFGGFSAPAAPLAPRMRSLVGLNTNDAGARSGAVAGRLWRRRLWLQGRARSRRRRRHPQGLRGVPEYEEVPPVVPAPPRHHFSVDATGFLRSWRRCSGEGRAGTDMVQHTAGRVGG